MRRRTAVALGLLLAATGTSAAQTVNIDWVTVGNPGNAPDQTASGFGSVGYVYRMSKYEVTNDQWAAFLNAKAGLGDPLGLFNPSMASDPRGGVLRSGNGTAGDPYLYSTKTNMGNKPANYLGWYDSVRFANWLHNGQGAGDTESGAYTLLGGTPVPSNGNAITRNAGAQVWVPSEHEWHKAALYEPGASGNGYWTFGTRSDAIPTIAQADVVGNISNPGPNVVNYNHGADWNGLDGNVTTVGSAGPLSASHYGLYDTYGNVFEWCEEFLIVQGLPMRAKRGGSWVESEVVLFGGARSSAGAGLEIFSFGLRVASVPEPGTAALLIVALWATARRRACYGCDAAGLGANRGS